MEISILYEDDAVLVVNKPAGLIVHPDGKHEELSVVSWLLEHRPEVQSVGDGIDEDGESGGIRPGIVHRIDKETSGALIVAKTQPSFLFLKRQFQNREVKKRYHTFVFGNVKDDRGTIDRAIGRSPTDIRKWSAGRGARGDMRDAITRYRVLARGGGVTFVEAMPLTGRTHQIRAHFLAVNHPIVCDRLYAPRRGSVLGFERLALHARGVLFRGPHGVLINVEAPYPDDFVRAIALHSAPVAQ